VEMVGVCQEDRNAQVFQVLRRKGFYGPLRANGHKNRGFETSMGCNDFAQSCTTRLTPVKDSELQPIS